VSFGKQKTVSCYKANCISKEFAASIFKAEEYETLNSWFLSVLFYHTDTFSVFSLRIFFPHFYSYPPEPPSLPSSRNRTTVNLLKPFRFTYSSNSSHLIGFTERYTVSPMLPNIPPPLRQIFHIISPISISSFHPRVLPAPTVPASALQRRRHEMARFIAYSPNKVSPYIPFPFPRHGLFVYLEDRGPRFFQIMVK
jgi:hypothetical protein